MTAPTAQTQTHRVAAVVLTYNSAAELPDCLAGLVAQRSVDLRVIVVDNASRADERTAMEQIFSTALPSGLIMDAASADTSALQDNSALFLRNDENGGYSAGNNIGARMAAELDCSSVLIINPDVQLESSDYVATLSALIHAAPRRAVAASAVRNLTGAQENPMQEPDFAQEMLWPVDMISVGLRQRRKPTPPLPTAPCRVEKVSGACFLIRTDFLRVVGFFDQSVFLYCEESILMAQVRAAGWHMMMDPHIEALHAHRSSDKGDPRPRFRAWSNSRSYFHRRYSGYSAPRNAALALSRRACLALVELRMLAKSLRGNL